MNILFFQQKNVVIFPYVDLKHLHSLEIFTAGHTIVDLESTALHNLREILEFESTNTYSQAPSLYFIYNLDKDKVKEVMSLGNIRCVLNASENVAELVNGSNFVFYNKKSNQFLNLDEKDLAFEEHLITTSGNKEVLQDTIQKIKMISSRIFAELNQDGSLENLAELLKEFDPKYWKKILDFTSSYFDIEIPEVSQLSIPDRGENPKKNLKDYSDEYTILVSTNKVIGKEFIQLLHDYRSKRVNSSHLVLEQLFNPLELYNYLRNHHWKEGIPESFVKEWSTMSFSQYKLTEEDIINFETILSKLDIHIPVPKLSESDVVKTIESKPIISPQEGEVPSVKDFPTFKAWVYETLGEIENLLGIQSVNSSIKDLANNSLSNNTTDLKKVIVDLTNILMADLDENRKMKTQDILLIRNQIISEGFCPILVTDASTLHHVNDGDEFRKLANDGILKQAPAGRKADIFVLKLARKQNCKFITNDKYADPEYRNEFGKEWIRKNRITFIFTDNVLILD